MAEGATDGHVEKVRYCARNSAGMAQRTIVGPSPCSVWTERRRAMLDTFVTDRTVVRWREVTLHAMGALWALKSSSMRCRLCVFVAFEAGVFFVAHTTALPIPRGLKPVHLSLPRWRMARRFGYTVAVRAVFLLIMTPSAKSGVHDGLRPVNDLPDLC